MHEKVLITTIQYYYCKNSFADILPISYNKRKTEVKIMQLDVLEVAAIIAGSYNVAFHQYEFSEKGITAFDQVSFDGGIREWCLPDYHEQDYLLQLFKKIQTEQLVRIIDIFECRYLLMRCAIDDRQRVLVIGPYLCEPNTQDITRNIQNK